MVTGAADLHPKGINSSATGRYSLTMRAVALAWRCGARDQLPRRCY